MESEREPLFNAGRRKSQLYSGNSRTRAVVAEKVVKKRPEDVLKDKTRKRSVLIIQLTVFIGSAMYTIVLPSMPQYLNQIHAESYVLGWLVSAFSLGQFLASPPLGMWFNRRGAMEALIMCGVLLILGNVLYAIGWNKWALVVARFIIGVGAANVSVARAYLGVVTPQEERTGVFAMFAAMQGIGFVVGPAMGSALAKVNYKIHVGGNLYPNGDYLLDGATAAGWFSTVICIINLILIAVWFVDVPVDDVGKSAETSKNSRVYDTIDQTTQPDDVPRAIPNRPTTPTTVVPLPARTDVIPERTFFRSIDKTVDLLAVNICMFVFFLVILIFAIFETILAKVVDDLYDWKTAKSGILFMACGVVSIFAFACIKPLAKKVSDRFVLACGLVGMIGAGLICLDFKSDNIPLWRFLIAQALFSIGYPWASAILYALFSKILGETKQGTMIGILTAAGSAARTIGPLAAGYGYYYGHTKAVYIMIGGSALLALITTVIFWRRLQDYEILLERIIAKYSKGYGRLLIQ